MRTSRRFLILVIIVGTMLLLTTSLTHSLSFVTYITRPIWDTPSLPFNIITHYSHPSLDSNTTCQLHSWTLNEQKTRVFDAILFSVELDLLEIRLRELYDVVDKFVILESNTTFTGRPKEAVFALNRDRFKWAEDKIVYKLLELAVNTKTDPFKIEQTHRIAMNDVIRDAGISIGEWVLMTDVDEIPSKATVSLLKDCGGIPSPLHLQLRNYIYSFEFLVDMDSWRAKAVRYPHFYGHARQSNDMLSDSGWHCSFCFRFLKDFVFKMEAYSHADRVHSKKVLGLERIQEVICEGKDIFDMVPETMEYKEMVRRWGGVQKSNSGIQLPIEVLRNKEKYSFLLPGGCIREL